MPAITSEIIKEATTRFKAAGNTVKPHTDSTFRVRKLCAWCPTPLKLHRRFHKLCPSCAQTYNRKISTLPMLELQAVNLDLYQSAKADIFSDGVRHGV